MPRQCSLNLDNDHQGRVITAYFGIWCCSHVWNISLVPYRLSSKDISVGMKWLLNQWDANLGKTTITVVQPLAMVGNTANLWILTNAGVEWITLSSWYIQLTRRLSTSLGCGVLYKHIFLHIFTSHAIFLFCRQDFQALESKKIASQDFCHHWGLAMVTPQDFWHFHYCYFQGWDLKVAWDRINQTFRQSMLSVQGTTIKVIVIVTHFVVTQC